MKKLRLIIPFSCAALALALAPLAVNAAEGDAPTSAPSGFRGANRDRGPQLTKEERTKLFAALKKARESDEVVAAQKAYTEAQKKLVAATKAAAIKADPSVEEILKKTGDAALLRPGADRGGPGRAGPGGQRRRGGEKPPAPPAE
ncbi:MAG: hypothetical protein LBV54_02845 [Puniceicoccales bacterium]|nr:hypothetical protein [Puniceicoccales bacterium]